MKNQNIYVSIAIIIVAIGLGIYLGHRSVTAPATGPAVSAAGTNPAGDDTAAATGDKSYTLSCDSDKSLVLTFHLPGDKSVDIMTDDGRMMTLDNTSTSSAASYTSADGKDSLSLSTSGTISLTESGVATYSNCTEGAPAAGTDQTGQ